jgi:hypothetical protein
MKLTLFLTCLFLASMASAQPTILEESYIADRSYINDLKGAVKGCILYENDISHGTYHPSDTVPKSIGFFDEQKRLIELQSGPVSTPAKYAKTVFTYTASGHLKEITEFLIDGVYYRNWVFKTDRKGNIIEQTGYESTYGKRPFRINEYKYDENDRLIEIHKHTGYPLGVSSVTGQKEKYEDYYYEYDTKGFVVKSRVVRRGFGSPFDVDGTAEYVNDAAGNPLVHYVIGKQNVREKFEESTYYETGLIQKKITHLDGSLTLQYRYEYQYDEHGNWTTKKEYKISGKGESTPTKTTTRKITYY